MIRRPLRSTRMKTLLPYTTLVRSCVEPGAGIAPSAAHHRKRRAAALANRLARPGVKAQSHTICRDRRARRCARSEEHTSELQSLMRISYAVFCLKKKRTEYTHMIQDKQLDKDIRENANKHSN